MLERFMKESYYVGKYDRLGDKNKVYKRGIMERSILGYGG